MADNQTPQDVIEAVKKWTVLELSEFIKLMEEEFGVTAAAPVAVAAAGAPVAADAAGGEEEEKDTFDVILISAGEKKIPVIKEVRAITNLGLKEAKALVEEAPKPVKEGVKQDEADKIKKQIEDAGGSVELK